MGNILLKQGANQHQRLHALDSTDDHNPLIGNENEIITLTASGMLQSGGHTLSEYALTGHTHDGRYYTETEIDNLLTGKSDTDHTHDDRYYTQTQLDADQLTQYALLAGRSGGQTLNFGLGSGEGGTISSTAHGTKGSILFGTDSVYDEVNDRWGLGELNPDRRLHVNSGGQAVAFLMESGTVGCLFDLRTVNASPSYGGFRIQDGTPTTYGFIGYDWTLGNIVFALSQATLATPFIAANGASGNVGIGTGAPETRIEVEEEKTLIGNVADDYAAALTFDPGYTGAFTVTRHNYMDINDISLAGGAAVTDAAVMRFDAAIGTHKAVAAAFQTTDSNGDTTDWTSGIIVNHNGVLHKIPTVIV